MKRKKKWKKNPKTPNPSLPSTKITMPIVKGSGKRNVPRKGLATEKLWLAGQLDAKWGRTEKTVEKPATRKSIFPGQRVYLSLFHSTPHLCSLCSKLLADRGTLINCPTNTGPWVFAGWSLCFLVSLWFDTFFLLQCSCSPSLSVNLLWSQVAFQGYPFLTAFAGNRKKAPAMLSYRGHRGEQVPTGLPPCLNGIMGL